jgi:hypothetical protein
MSKVPFEEQRLPVDLVEQIERDIALGNAVLGNHLLGAIEQSVDLQLAARLRDIVSKFSIPAVKRRGRPSHCKGREDFAMEELDSRYPMLLMKHRREFQQRRSSAAAEATVLPMSERTPSELAYRELLQDMRADFSNIDWLALRTKYSQWKTGHFHPAENHVDSQDFDAEVSRLFPGS